jgi:hypothetical protein
MSAENRKYNQIGGKDAGSRAQQANYLTTLPETETKPPPAPAINPVTAPINHIDHTATTNPIEPAAVIASAAAPAAVAASAAAPAAVAAINPVTAHTAPTATNPIEPAATNPIEPAAVIASAAAPAAVIASAATPAAVATEPDAVIASVADEPDADAPASDAQAGTEEEAGGESGEFEEAIQTASELLNQINANAVSDDADDASEFQSAVETVNDVLKQLKQLDTNNQNDDNNDTSSSEADTGAGADNCGLRPSLLSSAPESCYSEKLPPVQQLIQKAIVNELANTQREIAVAGLQSLGAKNLESAILDKNTLQQIIDLKANPATKNLVEKFEKTMTADIKAGEEVVTGEVKNAVDNIVRGGVQEFRADLAVIPGMPVAEAVVTAVTTANNVGTQLNDIINTATNTISDIKHAASDATAAAAGAANAASDATSDAASQAVAGAANAANNATAAVGDAATKVAGDATAAVGDAASQAVAETTKVADKAAGDATAAAGKAAGDATAAADKAAGDATTKVANTAAAKKGGGYSRKRRHINKLSRRIERTLRRVQKKYGLQDKNSFLRRTLRREK